jgi:hypothetical protein
VEKENFESSVIQGATIPEKVEDLVEGKHFEMKKTVTKVKRLVPPKKEVNALLKEAHEMTMHGLNIFVIYVHV